MTLAIQLIDISFIGVKGTATTKITINLSCSECVGCTNILLDNINIKSAYSKDVVSSSCIDAHGRSSNVIPPLNCLLN